jgi:hypothetical protein
VPTAMVDQHWIDQLKTRLCFVAHGVLSNTTSAPPRPDRA